MTVFVRGVALCLAGLTSVVTSLLVWSGQAVSTQARWDSYPEDARFWLVDGTEVDLTAAGGASASTGQW